MGVPGSTSAEWIEVWLTPRESRLGSMLSTQGPPPALSSKPFPWFDSVAIGLKGTTESEPAFVPQQLGPPNELLRDPASPSPG